jgi:hypothetical protein
VTFRFTGTDNGTIVGFECRLDGGQFAPCTSPRTYTGVSRGSHSFRAGRSTISDPGTRARRSSRGRDEAPTRWWRAKRE